MFEVRNLTNDVRKFTERKTGKVYLVEPKKKVITEFEPIDDISGIFEIKKIEKQEEPRKETKSKIKEG